MVSRRKVEQQWKKETDRVLRTHPKWQRWLWEYDAYKEVDMSVAADSILDCGERSHGLLPNAVENKSRMI